MANLKQIRKHIASVQNTGKITKAMKMVAVSKLRKSQAAVVATRPYANELINTIEHLVAKTDASQHPLLRNHAVKENAVLIVVSGDKGLCGAYNHNIVKSAKKFVEERRAGLKSLKLIFVGRKAYEAMRHVEGIEKVLVPNTKRPVVDAKGNPIPIEEQRDVPKAAVDYANELSKSLSEDFREGRIAEAQARMSQEVAGRLTQELPALFADDPQALAYVQEAIDQAQDTLADIRGDAKEGQ